MSIRIASSLLFPLAVLACGPVSRMGPRLGADLPPADTTQYSFDAVARGRIVFDNACIRCHGLDAPRDSAPDMRLIARRYRAEFADEAEAAERVAAWIGAPSRSQTRLPEGVVDHWGVMPRVALDRDLALDVGHYVWSLGEPIDTSAAIAR